MVEMPHDQIKWDESKISFFWESYSSKDNPETRWMSKGSYAGIMQNTVRFLPKKYLDEKRTICDYGCGTGFFAEELAKQGHKVFGVEQKNIVEILKLEQTTFTPVSDLNTIPDGTLDLIFCLEVIEHLLESELQSALSTWERKLKPGGFLVLSTPNDEDLAKSSIICPNCRTEFHKIQHVRSWQVESISSYLTDSFSVKDFWAGELFFDTESNLIWTFLRKIKFALRTLFSWLRRRKQTPHLMILAVRK
jgi:2-polyprenyl-3-methyl-5-hydroxy-6-metoxy-1,4-benzoquinol methylase